MKNYAIILNGQQTGVAVVNTESEATARETLKIHHTLFSELKEIHGLHVPSMFKSCIMNVDKIDLIHVQEPTLTWTQQFKQWMKSSLKIFSRK